ncbi:MAG: hypothetical protein KF716_07600 [Anaerolineae bacterium]|nr:hypothetical protein [Anaerolineae bacterium]
MPILIDLIENDHVVQYTVTEPWSPSEILPAKAKSHEIFGAAAHTLHVLVDLRKATFNLSLINAAQQVIGGEHLPNSGEIVVVGIGKMLRMIATPILKVAAGSDPVSFFDSPHEALTYLRKLY